jgi:hypothetical protein
MLPKILSILFPPKLPGKIRDWNERVEDRIDEQGWAGNVREHYRDGIQRHWAETPRTYRTQWGTPEYHAQMLDAEETSREMESDLIAAGYIEVAPSEWMKVEEIA